MIELATPPPFVATSKYLLMSANDNPFSIVSCIADP
jgi:hypothetical protein